MKKLMIMMACAALFTQIGAFAQAAQQDPQLQANASSAAVQDKLSEPDGVAIAIKPDGSFQIFARGSGTYQFNNPKAKQIAAKNAVMRAKANLSKFLKEKVASKESLDDVATNTLAMSSDGNTQSQQASMESVEQTSEAIRNESEAILTGVVTLKQQTVPSGNIGGEVQVTVGISSKTLKAANQLATGINTSLQDRDPNVGPGSTPASPAVPSTPPPNKPEVLISNTDF